MEFLGLNNPAISNPTVAVQSPDIVPERLTTSDDLDLVKSLIDINKEVDTIIESYDTGGKCRRDQQTPVRATKTNPLRFKKSEQIISKKTSKKNSLKHEKSVGNNVEEFESYLNPKLVLERSEVCPVHGDVSVWTTVCNHSNDI